ncbi:uncharacterized protein CANTADRAFT_27420 [Suhomyces tanzawaensis NRRL Y-17324]|uniref:Exocyst complex component Sec3 PIP2-binding N-terminal domain-containing protein n=1 Tax=Suhomyces tanzawaensis NRRL Y-17324 TaxID=984487 RepID=A0A1E4SBX4_9ASCO|nr:uncharacterized protein CANTADRAFT_27420 [Suhomyces tanzawaensis NRRL Y-17324]ODV77003.1 hypothetical protein CANTADRAFT_27420 [Suhomyces tanzawaensis NRRL Y-17324]
MYPRGVHPNNPPGLGPAARPGQRPPQGMAPRGAPIPQPGYPRPMGVPGGPPQPIPPNARMPRHNPGPPQGGPNGPPPPLQDHMRQRRSVSDKLISDCYSQYTISKSGKRVPEISYQTHLAITEFSAFPSQPPPENLPPSKLGSVKPRVIVMCVKQSGRVLLQKGKFNDAKKIYQIGRTWDLDELKSISRAGANGIILSLNKDYFWRVEENMERIWKFVRTLANAYGGFTGRYPELHGFTLQELQLPPTPVHKPLVNSPTPNAVPGNQDIVLNEPVPDPALLKSKSLKRKNLPNPVLPAEPKPAKNAADYYPGFDFTSNGQLPLKPMNVILLDRSGTTTADTSTAPSAVHTSMYSTDREATTPALQSHPYKQRSPYSTREDDTKSNTEDTDPHSFVFTNSPQKQNYSPERLHQYAKESGETSPLRKFKPNVSTSAPGQRNVSEGLENSAALANRLENRLGNPNNSDDLIREFGESLPKPPKPTTMSPDFGIEEITDESDGEKTPIVGYKRRGTQPNIESEINAKGLGINTTQGIIGESTNIEDRTDMIDSSIQEIEDLLDSQLSFGGSESVDNSFQFKQSEIDLNDTLMEGSDDLNETEELFVNRQRSVKPSNLSQTVPTDPGHSMEEDESMFTQNETAQIESELKIRKKEALVPVEKDSELEEILEEVNWSILDTSDSLVKKLSKELNNVKQKNVKELIGLDFSKNEASNDMIVSIGEIENFTQIFKKMEVDFKFLASDINQIENDSQGLQVKSINKKILFKDLKGILDKVSINQDDLRAIEDFKDFERLNKLESLEKRLLKLYDALGTIRNDEDNDLSSMRALIQYRATYEKVATRFIKHFNNFSCIQFKTIVGQLSENLTVFRPSALLRELNNLLIYSSITYFVKDVDLVNFQQLNDYFSQQLEEFLENLIRNKIKGITFTTAAPIQSDPSTPVELKKSRTLRLSRKISKLGHSGSNDDTEQIQQHLDNLKKYKTQNSNEIEDPKVIMEIIEETKDLIVNVQFFVAAYFHYDKSNTLDFNEFVQAHPYRERREFLDEMPSTQIERLSKDQTFSTNELIAHMTSIFGNFINVILKKINPVELNLPIILIYLETAFNEYTNVPNLEYLTFNFLKKMIDKFRNGWNKFIRSQIENINNSMVMAKGGILPAIKNVNQLLLIIESSLENNHNLADTLVRSMLDSSYADIAASLVDLFTKDDPLLKNHEFDDKEREYRNINILQNIYYILQQLEAFSTVNLKVFKLRLQEIFDKVEKTYFQRILTKSIGKLIEFITNYEALEKMNNGKPKKYNKKFIKSLLSGYNHKDLTLKVEDIEKKLEKHFIIGKDMFEKDLLDRLWKDTEEEFVDYFKRLERILRSGFEDVDGGVSSMEVRQIFRSVH